MTMPPFSRQEKLDALRNKLALDLPDLVRHAVAACQSFWRAPWDETLFLAAERQLHTLSGTLGTYGFGDLYTTARTLKTLLATTLEPRTHLGEPEQRSARDLAHSLEEQADRTASSFRG